MTGPRDDATVRIGPPAAGRIGSAVFAVVWVVALTSFFVAGLHRHATAPLAVLAVMLVVGLGICYRNAVLGLRSDGDTLTVRGPFSTRRVRRDRVAEVRRGTRTSAGPGSVVVVVTTDGDMVFGPPTTLLPFGRRSDAAVDRQVEQVRAWARG